jgi:hypothetical protein
MTSTIFDYVKEQRTAYRAYTIEIADGYDYSQYQTLRTIELYYNSKFTTGNLDSLKREKPFYNICKFRVNVATRATDIDTAQGLKARAAGSPLPAGPQGRGTG